ncbi:hypothetical protein [Rhizobium sp. RM]|uniref:hypothetical protein n=1 Tax=Rhizobium sp. RM TaxID=2748079 RepID=UPI00110D8B58|nr:hypothetical protein [Rhizobium sp. RM]NWJ23474.1 hypothetical protein [Rhizobium sp. RM]TMV19314.1 hypothetical protein BJG94_14565 [Rhizobium sp. Td3]
MLPPVPKVPAADASYNSTTLSAGKTQPVVRSTVSTTPVGDESGGSLFAKATIASLASEYQLSRSTFILSETLGKLMNLPRKDGEAIETYVARLTEALRALRPAQRAALEQQVSKALQGLTLSMLAEILKNPAGPDAARLALLIEMSRYKGLDLAAKAVVTSYQQNNRIDQPASQPQPPRMPDAARPSQSEQSGNGPVTSQPAASSPVSSPANRLVAQVLNQFTQLAAPMKEAIVARMAAMPDLPLVAEAQEADGLEQQPQSGKAAAASEAAIRSDRQQTPADGVKAAAAHLRPDDIAKTETRPTPSHTQAHEAATRQRVEIRNALNALQNQIALPIKETESLLFAALTGKTLIASAGNEQPLPAPPSTVLEPAVEQSGEKPKATTLAAQQPTTEPETPAQHPHAQVAARTAAELDGKAAFLEQAAAQPLVASLLAKEGTTLPFVSYPLAKDEPESETPHRGHGPFSEGEAEDEPPDQGAGDDLEERAAANDEMQAAPEDDDSDGMRDETAEAYYLRMGGIV